MSHAILLPGPLFPYSFPWRMDFKIFQLPSLNLFSLLILSPMIYHRFFCTATSRTVQISFVLLRLIFRIPFQIYRLNIREDMPVISRSFMYIEVNTCSISILWRVSTILSVWFLWSFFVLRGIFLGTWWCYSGIFSSLP